MPIVCVCCYRKPGGAKGKHMACSEMTKDKHSRRIDSVDRIEDRASERAQATAISRAKRVRAVDDLGSVALVGFVERATQRGDRVARSKVERVRLRRLAVGAVVLLERLLPLGGSREELKVAVLHAVVPVTGQGTKSTIQQKSAPRFAHVQAAPRYRHSCTYSAQCTHAGRRVECGQRGAAATGYAIRPQEHRVDCLRAPADSGGRLPG